MILLRTRWHGAGVAISLQFQSISARFHWFNPHLRCKWGGRGTELIFKMIEIIKINIYHNYNTMIYIINYNIIDDNNNNNNDYYYYIWYQLLKLYIKLMIRSGVVCWSIICSWPWLTRVGWVEAGLMNIHLVSEVGWLIYDGNWLWPDYENAMIRIGVQGNESQVILRRLIVEHDQLERINEWNYGGHSLILTMR